MYNIVFIIVHKHINMCILEINNYIKVVNLYFEQIIKKIVVIFYLVIFDT